MTSTLQARWGSRIRDLRQQRGYSVAKLARLADVDQGQLSRAERGLTGIGDEARIRLARALGRSVEDLFPYPDTTDQETACPSAASAKGADSSPTPATAAGTRSPAPSATAAAASGREGRQGSE